MTTTKQRLRNVITELHEWALRNFGRNQSKRSSDPHIVLDSVAPLLGMFEEVGELNEAVRARNPEEVEDSVADFLIFSCDFFTRMFGIDVAVDCIHLGLTQRVTSEMVRPTISMGRLAHRVLKSHQGIRGTTEGDLQLQILENWLNLLEYVIQQAGLKHHRHTLLAVLERIWSKVKQRDWVANPVAADAVAEFSE